MENDEYVNCYQMFLYSSKHFSFQCENMIILHLYCTTTSTKTLFCMQPSEIWLFVVRSYFKPNMGPTLIMCPVKYKTEIYLYLSKKYREIAISNSDPFRIDSCILDIFKITKYLPIVNFMCSIQQNINSVISVQSELACFVCRITEFIFDVLNEVNI